MERSFLCGACGVIKIFCGETPDTSADPMVGSLNTMVRVRIVNFKVPFECQDKESTFLYSQNFKEGHFCWKVHRRLPFVLLLEYK